MPPPAAAMSCRPGCGACCIAPSISAPMPGYPAGKLAGVRCPHLTEDIRCALFGTPQRPAVCRDLQPQAEMCGESVDQAMATLARWERLTAPQR
ncbi:MAG: YkgJ family cysteine cluster protein [Kofleriaceae bacterium]